MFTENCLVVITNLAVIERWRTEIKAMFLKFYLNEPPK